MGLPKNMVRRIMKIGEDTRNISNEALVIVVKARSDECRCRCTLDMSTVLHPPHF